MTSIARRPAPTTEPTPSYTQAQLRDRRQRWLSVEYGRGFSLTTEVRQIISPLGKQVAKLSRPYAMRPEIDNLADAVHEVLSIVVGMLAESRLSPDAHARTVQGMRDLAVRPNEPIISDEEIDNASWTTVLVNHVDTHSGDLSVLLGSAYPTGHPRIADRMSISERLTEALRILDEAAAKLARRIPEVARYQRLPSMDEYNAANRARREAQRAEQAVVKMTRPRVGIAR